MMGGLEPLIVCALEPLIVCAAIFPTPESAMPESKITHFAKALEGYVRTLELKIFHGALWQKHVAGHPGAEPAHIWVPVENHDAKDAPHEELAAAAASSETASDPVPSTEAPATP